MSQYTTIALVQAELQSADITASTTPSSSDVDTWITEASAEIEVMSGEIFTTSLASSEYYDYDGGDMLRTLKLPIVTLSEVLYNKNHISSSSSDWVSLEEGQGKNYILYGNEGDIKFINGNGATNLVTPAAGNKKFCLTYTWGYTSTPPEIQRLATLLVARRTISTLVNSQANTEGGEVQVGPIRVKDPSSFSVSYLKQLDNEIDNLKNNLGLGFRSYRSRRNYEV